MGIFSPQAAASTGIELNNPNELLESYIVYEVSGLDESAIQEFCKPGGEGEALVEAGVLRKKTLVKLSKNDDLTRRKTMAAFQLAKEAKSPLWDKLVKNRVMERKLIGDIVGRFGAKAEKAAKIGQRDYLKHKMPVSFMRAGGDARLQK